MKKFSIALVVVLTVLAHCVIAGNVKAPAPTPVPVKPQVVRPDPLLPQMRALTDQIFPASAAWLAYYPTTPKDFVQMYENINGLILRVNDLQRKVVELEARIKALESKSAVVAPDVKEDPKAPATTDAKSEKEGAAPK
jgi:hypothetical protein